MENNMRPKSKNTKWYVWLFVALLGALLLSNLAGETIKNMFFSLLAGLTPIIIAVILSFLLLHPIGFIENKLLKNAFVGNPRAHTYKRLISLSVCYVIIIGVIVVLLVTMVPYVISTLEELVSNSDTIISDLKTQITNLIVSLTGLPTTEVQDYLQVFFDNMTASVSAWFSSIGNDLANIVSVAGNVVFVVLMSLLLSFLMLKDKELISNTARRYTYAYHTKKKADELIITTRRSRKVLDQWVVCNLIVMLVIFVVAWIGYAIIGIRFAGLLALVLAIFSIIPYIGGFIAMIPVVMISLVFGTTSQMLAAVIFGLLVWAIITSILPVFIMSSRLKTRAVVLLLTLVIGGAIFGIWGMLLSGPIAAILTVWLQERLEIKESARESEEIIESDGTVALSGIGDMLDSQEDVDPTVLDALESPVAKKGKNMIKKIQTKRKSNKNTRKKKTDKKQNYKEETSPQAENVVTEDNNKSNQTDIKNQNELEKGNKKEEKKE